MKGKEGISKDDLISYYENHHSLLGKKIFQDNGFAPIKYMRKYFHSISDILPFADTLAGSEFDLAMEMWFESREHFEKMIEISSPEEVWKIIIEDENRFLDPYKRAIFILEEHETKFD
ncbi:EthD domain-containing protein [Sphingobium sp. AN558]|uniref:EthD domain-containing protein n=1 Tax=Sphingobium sp. AN558 TaxID=3133442 RepID=UPI0030BBE68B